jgi:hypothetical protein
MNKARWLKSTIVSLPTSILLLTSGQGLKIDYLFKQAAALSQQLQETRINLNSVDLKQPNLLNINLSQSTRYMTGEVKLNGKLIKKLSQNSAQVDLAPALKRGSNRVTVFGKYSPASASISLDFSGPHNQISQQMAGSGLIQVVLLIEVQ